VGTLDAPALRRPAAVMRDRGDVADGGDGHARGLQRAQRALAAGAGTGDVHLQGAHAVLGRLLAGVLRGHLGRVRRRLARALEAHRPGARPRDGVALRVGDGDRGVVERGVHVRHARGDVLALALFDAGRFLGHASYFFLPAIGFAGPLRVRALV